VGAAVVATSVDLDQPVAPESLVAPENEPSIPSSGLATDAGDGGDGDGDQGGGGKPIVVPGPLGDPGTPPTSDDGRPKQRLIIGGVAVALVLGVVGFLLASSGGGGEEGVNTTESTIADTTSEPADSTTSASEPEETTTTPATTVAVAAATVVTTAAPPDVCNPAAPDLCIEITSVQVQSDGESLLVFWEATNFTSSISANHSHFFWSSSDVEKVGSQFDGARDPWDAIAAQPFATTAVNTSHLTNQPNPSDELCATPADGSHAVVDTSIFHCVSVEG